MGVFSFWFYMSNIINFKFDSLEIRAITTNDGEPWFVAQDVSNILEYSEASAMTRTLDDEEKGLQIVQTLGGQQEMLMINESGLYSAILRSRRQEAKRFKKWVTSEVLPAIRKTGSYAVAPKSPAHMLLAMAQQFVEIEAEQRRQAEQVAVMSESVAVLEAKLDNQSKHFSVVAWCNLQGRHIDVTNAAKNGKKLAEYSRENGLDIGKVSDPRFGEVNIYHKAALAHVLGPLKKNGGAA